MRGVRRGGGGKESMLGLHLSTHHDSLLREYVQYMYMYSIPTSRVPKTKQKGKQLAENQIEKTSEPAQG